MNYSFQIFVKYKHAHQIKLKFHNFIVNYCCDYNHKNNYYIHHMVNDPLQLWDEYNFYFRFNFPIII